MTQMMRVLRVLGTYFLPERILGSAISTPMTSFAMKHTTTTVSKNRIHAQTCTQQVVKSTTHFDNVSGLNNVSR